jgi:hypothetical protein
LTTFDISSNAIKAEGGRVLAAGLKGNQVMTELNISSNDLGYNEYYDDDVSGAVDIADAISDMAAMSTLIFGDKQAITMTSKMTEAAFSSENLGEAYEAQIAAAFLGSRCGCSQGRD